MYATVLQIPLGMTPCRLAVNVTGTRVGVHPHKTAGVLRGTTESSVPAGWAVSRGRGRESAALLGVTSIYLQGIDSADVIDAVHSRRGPMIPAAAALRT